ncbi:hypothetical protein D3C77_619730 [compost metagenome]
MGQSTGKPGLVVPVAPVAVGEHQQWMLASSWRRVTNGRGTDKHHIIADQLRGCGRCTGVPNDHLQWAVIVRVRQCGRLEADRVLVSKGDSRQTGQQ